MSSDSSPSATRERAEGALAIVIPVHGAFGHVESCLRSVVAAGRTRDRIVVVDDASPDPSRLRDLVMGIAGDRVVLVHHPERRGFSAAVNAGVASARRLGAASVLILNSDTVVLRDSIDRLEHALLAHPQVGAVGPLSNSAGPQSVPDSSRSTFDRLLLRPPTNDLDPVALERVAAVVAGTGTDHDEAIDVPLLHGFAMLIRLSAFDQVGGLDACRFPSGYGAETDLSFRLRGRGWRLRVVTGALLWHAGSGSTTARRRLAGVIRGRLVLGRIHGGSFLRAARRRTGRSLALPELRLAMSEVAPTLSTARAPSVSGVDGKVPVDSGTAKAPTA